MGGVRGEILDGQFSDGLGSGGAWCVANFVLQQRDNLSRTNAIKCMLDIAESISNEKQWAEWDGEWM